MDSESRFSYLNVAIFSGAGKRSIHLGTLPGGEALAFFPLTLSGAAFAALARLSGTKRAFCQFYTSGVSDDRHRRIRRSM